MAPRIPSGLACIGISRWIVGSIPRCVDSLIDRSIVWSVVCLPSGYGDSFLRALLLVLFYSVPCAHERCDPCGCGFLLALRGFVELISVMVRFRSSVLFRPRPPGGGWKLRRLETWAKRIDKTRSRNRLTMWYMIIALGPNICIDSSSDPRSTCELAKLGPNMLKKRWLEPNILTGKSEQKLKGPNILIDIRL